MLLFFRIVFLNPAIFVFVLSNRVPEADNNNDKKRFVLREQTCLSNLNTYCRILFFFYKWENYTRPFWYIYVCMLYEKYYKYLRCADRIERLEKVTF